MKLDKILGNRILVKPLDLIKKKEGKIHLPATGEHITSSPCYQAEVLQVGDGPFLKGNSSFFVGSRLLLMKGGALELPDGTRVVSTEDVIGVVAADEPAPE